MFSASVNMAASTPGRSAALAGPTYLLCLQSKWSLWTKALSSQTDRTFPFLRRWPAGPEVYSQDAPESHPRWSCSPQCLRLLAGAQRFPAVGKEFRIFKQMHFVSERNRYGFSNNQLVRVRRKLIELPTAGKWEGISFLESNLAIVSSCLMAVASENILEEIS